MGRILSNWEGRRSHRDSVRSPLATSRAARCVFRARPEPCCALGAPSTAYPCSARSDCSPLLNPTTKYCLDIGVQSWAPTSNCPPCSEPDLSQTAAATRPAKDSVDPLGEVVVASGPYNSWSQPPPVGRADCRQIGATGRRGGETDLCTLADCRSLLRSAPPTADAPLPKVRELSHASAR